MRSAWSWFRYDLVSGDLVLWWLFCRRGRHRSSWGPAVNDTDVELLTCRVCRRELDWRPRPGVPDVVVVLRRGRRLSKTRGLFVQRLA